MIDRNIWNLIENLTYNEFIKLFMFYDSEKHFQTLTSLMFLSQKLRNAAHNNVLIHNLAPGTQYKYTVCRPLGIILGECGIRRKTVKRILSYPITHDLSASVILLQNYASEGIIKKRMEDLDTFMNICRKKQNYFRSHIHLISLFRSFEEFLKMDFRSVLTSQQDRGYNCFEE